MFLPARLSRVPALGEHARRALGVQRMKDEGAHRRLARRPRRLIPGLARRRPPLDDAPHELIIHTRGCGRVRPRVRRRRGAEKRHPRRRRRVSRRHRRLRRLRAPFSRRPRRARSTTVRARRRRLTRRQYLERARERLIRHASRRNRREKRVRRASRVPAARRREPRRPAYLSRPNETSPQPRVRARVVHTRRLFAQNPRETAPRVRFPSSRLSRASSRLERRRAAPRQRHRRPLRAHRRRVDDIVGSVIIVGVIARVERVLARAHARFVIRAVTEKCRAKSSRRSHGRVERPTSRTTRARRRA